jgi:glycosyltransferase involved in cell wall biosynthesis
MRIVFVSGASRSLLNFRGPLLKELVERGHELIACAPDASLDVRTGLAELGVSYRNIPLARAGLSPRGDLQTVRALHRLFREELPDRVLAYTAKPVIYSCLAAGGSGRPQVHAMITGLGYGFGGLSLRQRLLGVVVQRLYRIALRHATSVMFQNPDDRDLFVASGFVPPTLPVTIINGSGVSLIEWPPSPLPEKPVFLLVARLLADKGVREYQRAAQRLKARYPHARFLLVGYLDSNPLSIGAAELAAWQTDGAIEYLGRLEDVRPAYAAARVYVLPSYREGTPRTVLEAMAMGRPIVTTDAPGCRETVVDEVNGFLVPVRDDVALERAMERFILEPELAKRMGAESLRLAREKYDVHKVNAEILMAMGVDATNAGVNGVHSTLRHCNI